MMAKGSRISFRGGKNVLNPGAGVSGVLPLRIQLRVGVGRSIAPVAGLCPHCLVAHGVA